MYRKAGPTPATSTTFTYPLHSSLVASSVPNFKNPLSLSASHSRSHLAIGTPSCAQYLGNWFWTPQVQLLAVRLNLFSSAATAR